MNFSTNPLSCKAIQQQIINYSPLLAKFTDYLFIRKNINDPNKIQKWIILIIDRLKNKNDRPVINYDRVVINKNFILDQYLQNNKEFIEFKEKSDIIRLFKLTDSKFSVYWILWDFSETISNPSLFMNIFPILYKSYIGRSEPIQENKIQVNQKNRSNENLFIKKSQFELIIDRYLPLLQITNENFKEKLQFFSFLFDEMIKIANTEFSVLINNHLPLILADFTSNEESDNSPQKKPLYTKRKVMRIIKKSISMFDHDLEVICNFFKIPILQKINEVHRQLIVFNIFAKRYQKIQQSFKISINSIKSNQSNHQYINYIQTIISKINNNKETILLSMMKLFSKDTCPDFHFPMLHFIIKYATFKEDIFSFPENKRSPQVATTEDDPDTSTENQLIQEMSNLLHFGQIKDHFSFTKLAFTLAEQGIRDQNDVSSLVLVSRKCKRAFSALSIHKLLQIASSSVFLSRTVCWCFLPAAGKNSEGLPDRLFGSPGAVTVIVFFIMRAFEFLTVASIPNKYRTKQRLVADIVLSLYQRACTTLAEMKGKEKDGQSELENIENCQLNKERALSNEEKEECNEELASNNESKNECNEELASNNEKKEECNEELNLCNEIKESTKNAVSRNNFEEAFACSNECNEADKEAPNAREAAMIDDANFAETNDNVNDDAATFSDTDENCSYGNKNLAHLHTLRGLQLVKESAEVGVAILNAFDSGSLSLFNGEIAPADLFSLIDEISAHYNAHGGIMDKQKVGKKSATIDMINIGFAICNPSRIKISMHVFFKHILNELTRIPLQKFDLKYMCACFEPEFPLKKEFSVKKVSYLRIRDPLFAKKFYENEEAIFLNKVLGDEDCLMASKKEVDAVQSLDASDDGKRGIKNIFNSNLMEKMSQRKSSVFSKNGKKITSENTTEND
ncbi:hypothetical protein M9Y10_005291 [Tritrichomonas musculus]|uniref:Uncharacterized protein n=1 Tax=Tritrichomonas musculus TaxID=1915356 RepID=A0ABR2JL81_9EUKA